MKTLLRSTLYLLYVMLLACSISCDHFIDTFMGFDKPVPTDSEMEKNFRENKEDFLTLVRMFTEDAHLVRVDHTWTQIAGSPSSSKETGDPGLDGKRWEEYRGLFKQLGLEGGINRDEETGAIMFYYFAKGISVSGVLKGYYYSNSEMRCNAPLNQDLNNTTDGIHCKSIGENWYIYISR